MFYYILHIFYTNTVYFVLSTLLIMSPERRNYSLMASFNLHVESYNRFITESEICTIKIIALIKIKI